MFSGLWVLSQDLWSFCYNNSSAAWWNLKILYRETLVIHFLFNFIFICVECLLLKIRQQITEVYSTSWNEDNILMFSSYSCSCYIHLKALGNHIVIILWLFLLNVWIHLLFFFFHLLLRRTYTKSQQVQYWDLFELKA